MKTGLEQKAKDNAKAEVTEQLRAVNDKIEELKSLKPEVTAEELKQIKDEVKATVRALDILQIRVKSGTAKPTESVKSFNERIAEAVEAGTDQINKFNRGEIKSFTLEVKGQTISQEQKAVGALSTANVTGSTHWGAQSRPGIIMNQNQITHVRTLLPVRSADAGTDYYFMRENGNGEGSIAPTSEATAAATPTTQATGLKPQFDIDLVESSVKFETIAGWMLLSKKAMRNIPNLMGFLQARVPEKLMDAEDAQVLYGNGTSPNIKGILTSGNFVAGSAAGTTPLVEKIINDISLLEDTYKRIANGIAMRPADYYGFFKNKATGSGEYDLPQGVQFVNGVLYILGIPVAKQQL
jgi:HK97 family phage major capsid protein